MSSGGRDYHGVFGQRPKPQFKDLFPDYESYDSEGRYYYSFPNGFADGVTGLIVKSTLGSTNTLKTLVNLVLGSIPEGPTTNWGADFLHSDLSSAIYRLSQKSFSKTMDTITSIADQIADSAFDVGFNGFLAEVGFGYKLVETRAGVSWTIVDEPDRRTQMAVVATLPTLKSISEQTHQHLEQLLNNLASGSIRADKDAIRDALSAMEALLKQLTGANDIKDAVSVLKADVPKWGISEISKDGLSIWNKIHDLYPDVRHGNPSVSPLDRETVLYWIDRVLVFVRYIIRRI